MLAQIDIKTAVGATALIDWVTVFRKIIVWLI